MLPPYLNVPETRISTTSNGIRVATQVCGGFTRFFFFLSAAFWWAHARLLLQKVPGQTAAVGVWIDTGSVYENKANNGVAHFCEHLSFKGTSRRTQQGLEMEVENMGARLNAYTSREQTVYYANCFKQDAPKCVDILSDILQNAKFNEDAIEYERSVILREAEEVETMDEEVIMDHLHSVAFQGHPLGYTILGPAENIKSLKRNDLVSYTKTHYTGGRMVVSAAGDVDHEALVRQVETSFKDVPSKDVVSPSSLPRGTFTGSAVEIRDDTKPLVHVAFGVESVGWTDPKYFVFTVLQTLMGQWSRTDGTGRNSLSPLSETLATDKLAHSVSSFHTPYRDIGMWGTYLVAPPEHIEDACFHTMSEWVRLSKNVTEKEVQRAVARLKGQLLMQLDGTFAVAEDIGRQLLTLSRRMPAVELFARLDAIDARTVREVAREYLYNPELSLAVMGPIADMPDYQQCRAWLSNFRD